MKINYTLSSNKISTATIITIVLAMVCALGFLGFANSAHAQTPFISHNLSIGSKGADVTNLQQFLALNGAIYPQGLVTGYYGQLTAAAVTQFQVNYDLPQVGNVGPMTRAKINQVQASGNGLTIRAPVISTISVSTSTASNSSATISWTTDKNATGKIHYDTPYLNETEATANFQEPYISGNIVISPSLTNNQNVVINGLAPHTTYHYVIEAIDASGNVNISPQYAFTTSM
jgi:peptidoglycan hydrolase-like protein with peptidoglycan-binding domain